MQNNTNTTENTESVEERINTLEKVEHKIINLMTFMGASFEELAKDKPVGRHFETNVQKVKSSLCELEREINSQINYVNRISTGLAYERSVYKESSDLSQITSRNNCIYETLSAALETDVFINNQK